MKLPTRARYALRLMLDIAHFSTDGKPVRLESVAQRTGISRRYMDQIVMPLRNVSLIRGVKGPGGGYLLQRSPADIRLGEIIEAQIGPISLVDCVFDPESCDRSDDCTCCDFYGLLSARLKGAMDEFTLADLLDKKQVRRIRAEVERFRDS